MKVKIILCILILTCPLHTYIIFLCYSAAEILEVYGINMTVTALKNSQVTDKNNQTKATRFMLTCHVF